MKITTNQLKQIIAEELRKITSSNEHEFDPKDWIVEFDVENNVSSQMWLDPIKVEKLAYMFKSGKFQVKGVGMMYDENEKFKKALDRLRAMGFKVFAQHAERDADAREAVLVKKISGLVKKI